MAALIWAAWGDEWALDEKVSFNGATKQITVNSGVTAIDIATDVYSGWVRWTGRERQYLAAMRYSGFDPIPGGRTGATFFLQNGWKLVYDPNTTAVAGVLYSEDYDTAFWNVAGNPLYPATVAALVNSAVSTTNVVTGTALTAEQTANAVWQAAVRTLTASTVRADLAPELLRIIELAQVHGLVQGTDLVVTPTSRTAGSVVQTISGDGVNISIVSRT